MQLAERVQDRKTPALSLLCHRAKNLYNLANFYVRQELFHLESMLTYFDLDFMLHGFPAYQALPAQTAQQVLRQVAGDWRSFFAACRAYRKDPRKFLGAPRPPRYKPKGGESIATFTNQQCRIVSGWIRFPRKANSPPIKTRISEFQQVRVVPKAACYVIEIVYNVKPTNLGLNKRRALGIDLGVSNLVTAANNIGLPPFAVKGGAAKSINQFFNKHLAQLRSVGTRANGMRVTKRIERLNRTRTNKQASRCLPQDIPCHCGLLRQARHRHHRHRASDRISHVTECRAWNYETRNCRPQQWGVVIRTCVLGNEVVRSIRRKCSPATGYQVKGS